MDIDENWTNIEELDGRYEVSDLGRIRSKRKIRKLSNHKSGYQTICIKISGRVKTFYVHRLVAIYFIPNPEGKNEVNHKDGNKLNNNAYNLEWNTKSENMLHAFKNNLTKPHSRLRDIQHIESLRKMKKVYHYSTDLNLINEYDSVKEAGVKLNFSNNLSLYCRKRNITKLGIFSYCKLS